MAIDKVQREAQVLHPSVGHRFIPDVDVIGLYSDLAGGKAILEQSH